MRRLFLAMWPEDEQIDRLIHIQNGCSGLSGRYVAPENFHITLLFIGEVDNSTEGCLISHCQDISASPVTLTLSEVGYFPKSQILWFGPKHVPQQLLQLYTSVRAAANHCNIGRLSKRFKPHVSLVRNCIRPVTRSDSESFDWRINEFHLTESVLHPQGARYNILETFPLNACG